MTCTKLVPSEGLHIHFLDGQFLLGPGSRQGGYGILPGIFRVHDRESETIYYGQIEFQTPGYLPEEHRGQGARQKSFLVTAVTPPSQSLCVIRMHANKSAQSVGSRWNKDETPYL